MKGYRLHRKARAEYRQSLAHYEGEGDAIGWAFAKEVRASIDMILRFPGGWPADDHGTRHKPLRKFPYSIWYVERDDIIEILGIGHQKRTNFVRNRL